MGRSTLLIVAVVIGVAGWIGLQRYEILGLDQLQLARRSGTPGAKDGAPGRAPGKIRIASFNIQAFGPAKSDKPAVMKVLADVIRQFDVVALQEVRSKKPDALLRLLEEVNSTGRDYSLLVGPPVGRTKSKEQYVYAFDQATIVVDRTAAYTIDDPDDLLHRPPFVGWFRARGAPEDQAFTFTLVNVHTDPDEVADEVKSLDDVFFSVRDDGRNEDDVILLGDFNSSDQELLELGRISGITAAISGQPTNTRKTAQYDNLIFQLPATREYAGRNGVFDFMREFNLTLDQALRVSDHLPVWAEFSVREGGDSAVVIASGGSASVR